MTNRPGHTGCHCCTDQTATVKDVTHRDISTGDPHPEFNLLDARELLWGTDAGDLSGLTQETITQNCTANGSAVTRPGDGADEVAGHFRMSVTDVVPTVKNFSALHVVWTGQTFNAFDHIDHIAGGALVAHAAVSRRKPTTFTTDNMRTILFGANIEPVPVWGLIIRVGSTVLVNLTPNPGHVAFDPDGNGTQCWRPTSTGGLWRTLIDGKISSSGLTTAQARAYGLTVDPIATQLTHDVGLCFGIVTSSDGWTGDLESSYSATYDFDTLNIYREYYLNCVAAFVNKTTLTVSTPVRAATHVSNCEPVELAGISATLTLTMLPEWDINLHPWGPQLHYDAGYAYVGSATVTLPLGDVTITWYYTPCSRLTISFDQPSQYGCPVWVSIAHTEEFTDDLCDGKGDNATGLVTAPTIVGWYYRDFYQLCDYSAGDEILDTTWFGIDCINNPHQTSPTKTQGVIGECHGSDDPLPVCLQGTLPNQLPWMTDCWSLDPIAIGYRRRITNSYTGFGPGCDEDLTPCDFEPGGAHYPVLSACQFQFLQNMGFSFALESRGNDRIAGYLYMDITE